MAKKFQIMEPLSEKEYESLKQSIKEDGVLVPVEKDAEGNILDGHHRVKICEELGIDDFPVNIKTGFENEEEKRTYIRKINLARRHLNEKQKEKLIKGQLKDTPEKSNNQIAKILGVSHNTVIKYRKELEERCQIDNANKLEDTQGRKQPAEKPKTVPTRTKKDEEKAQKIVEKAEDGDETAQRELRELDKGKETVASAHRTLSWKETKENQEVPEVPDGKYNVILADPPWNYPWNRSRNRDVENHYPTMTVGEIKNIEVPVAEDSVLFLWATPPKLKEALKVMAAWGFDYKTCAVWDKGKIGMGYWFRGQHELLLVGKRGEFPPPKPGDRISSVIREEREEHSKKPKIHNLLEKWWPEAEYLELFAREERNGWTAWGDEFEN